MSGHTLHFNINTTEMRQPKIHLTTDYIEYRLCNLMSVVWLLLEHSRAAVKAVGGWSMRSTAICPEGQDYMRFIGQLS